MKNNIWIKRQGVLTTHFYHHIPSHLIVVYCLNMKRWKILFGRKGQAYPITFGHPLPAMKFANTLPVNHT